MRAVGARRAARDVSSVKGPVQQIGSSTEKTSKSFRRGFGNVRLFSGGLRASAGIFTGAAGALGVLGISGALKSMISEFQESRKVGRQTNAVIKSTHGSAGVTAKEVGNLAASLSNMSGVDDEVIQSGQNMLLTFTNVRNGVGKGNDVFDQATRTLVDMSAALGTEPRKSAIMLGKALNDPVKGITALRRVGVSFTKGQEDSIKKMVASGHTMQAQRTILKELNKEFGGSARAQADPIEKARVAWANLMEMLGGMLWPTITRGINIFGKFVTQIQNGTGAGGRFRGRVEEIVGKVKALVGWIVRNRNVLIPLAAGITAAVAAWRAFMVIQKVIQFVRVALGLWKAWRAGTIAATAAQYGLNVAMSANPIGIIIALIVGLAAGIYLAYKRSETFRNIVHKVWAVLKSAPGDVWGAFRSGLESTVNFVIDRLNNLIDGINKLPGVNIGHIGRVDFTSGGPPTAADVGQTPRGGLRRQRHGGAAGAQRGGLVSREGVIRVGEEGEELVHLPGGSVVEPHGGWPKFPDEIVVPVTLVDRSGRVMAKQVVRASLKAKAAR